MEPPSASQQQYEGAMLTQLIKNSERLAVVEADIAQVKTEISEIKKDIGNAKWLLVTIAIGVFVNLLSKPVLSLLS
ncbi:MAG: hypothetical protein AAFQ80_16575 [Cyanobacteria bacterium J06621_8]